ncbi:MAG: MnmC family methyltransferase [Nanoarchaeota archaeon]|nr:MnmC family methyltransferase [Nanoarchaeota archaeon]
MTHPKHDKADDLAELKEVITADGSITFHNPKYDSEYHSRSGAEEEAVKKYAEQSNLAELAKTEHSIRILDICFGIGYNSAAAIDAINAVDPKCSINVLGIDNDPQIIAKIQDVNSKFLSYDKIKKLSKNKINEKQHWVKEDNVQMMLFINDARIVLKMLAKENNPALRFDAVFLDPFSPIKCPELWTEDFFKDIRMVMKKKAVLVTYSCARAVRDNLKHAGFIVKDGQCIGRRGPSTIAVN